MEGRIEALRVALRGDEAALADAKLSAVAGPAPEAATRVQYEAQIAAATERRDLALRHAAAIREGLEAGVTVSSLSEIRDSVVIGQLLSQQSALDAQIAIESARLLPNHPIMRALTAQRSALLVQIRQEAASIANALEAEAKMDSAQIELLQSQLPALAAPAANVDTSALEVRIAARRAELDGLVDAYFDIPVQTAVPRTGANPLSVVNLAVVAIAGLAALVFQALLATRRRRQRAERDIHAWRADDDPELVVVEQAAPLRKAS
jgi:uncharacterized protein involved in exopolysaccharide biosynthesis